MPIETRPSFFYSVTRGIRGYLKGAIAGGSLGMAAGIALGAVVGAITGGLAAIATGAILFGLYGMLSTGAVGAFAGLATEVVKSRETDLPSAGGIVNLANMAFAQGVASAEIGGPETTKFRNKILSERGQTVAPTV